MAEMSARVDPPALTTSLTAAVDAWLDDDPAYDAIATVEDACFDAQAIKVVESDEDYLAAAEQWDAVKKAQKTATSFFDVVKKPVYAVWQRVSSVNSGLTKALKEEERRLGALIQTFTQRRDAERLAEERRMQQEADRIEAERREVIQRQHDEQLARATAAKQASADELREHGAVAEAEAVESSEHNLPLPMDPEPAPAPRPHLPRAAYLPPTQKVGGSRDHWKAEITDLRIYIKGIADGIVPIGGALEITEVKGTTPARYTAKFLTSAVKTEKSTMVYPGVHPFNDPVTVASRSRG